MRRARITTGLSRSNPAEINQVAAMLLAAFDRIPLSDNSPIIRLTSTDKERIAHRLATFLCEFLRDDVAVEDIRDHYLLTVNDIGNRFFSDRPASGKRWVAFTLIVALFRECCPTDQLRLFNEEVMPRLNTSMIRLENPEVSQMRIEERRRCRMHDSIDGGGAAGAGADDDVDVDEPDASVGMRLG